MIRKVLLALAVFAGPGSAQAQWHEASSKHFIVYSDGPAEELRDFTEQLERFDLSLRMLTGTPDKPLSPHLRVTVFMVRDVTEIQKLAGSRSVAGFYQARASGPVAFVPRKSSGPLDAQTILQHEYGHSFMFSTWPSAVFAKWFVEGFAEFVGTAYYKNDGSLVFGRPPEHRQYGLLEYAQVPADRLLRLNPGNLDDRQTHVLYGRGWLLTHYAILGGHAQELGDYIRLSNAGKADDAARVFGSGMGLDSKLNHYAKKASVPVVTIARDRVPVGEVNLRELAAGEAAVMPALVLSARGVDKESAPEVAAVARRLAAPYPADAAAQNELAEAEFDAENYAAAEAAADRALAAEPKSVHALLYKGMAQMELAKKRGETDPAAWDRIRSWFIRANKLDTEYPWPLILFYDSFEAAKQQPSQNAQDAVLGAYVLAPFDLGLRWTAGKVLLMQDNAAAARTAFETVAYSPHASATQNPALDIIEALNSKGTQAALKVVEDAEAKAKAEREAAEKKPKA